MYFWIFVYIYIFIETLLFEKKPTYAIDLMIIKFKRKIDLNHLLDFVNEIV